MPFGIFYLCLFLGGGLGGAFTTGFVKRQPSLSGLDAGLPAAEAVLAVLILVALMVARLATSFRQ